MLVHGQLAGKAPGCVCKLQTGHVARRGTVNFRLSASRVVTCPSNALYQQHIQILWQLRCISKVRPPNRSHSTRVQAAAAQQHFSHALSGSGAGGALPSMQFTCSRLSSPGILINLSAGLVNWVNTSKPPKYLWRTLAALLMGGQALVRILQGGYMLAAPPPCSMMTCLVMLTRSMSVL